MKLFSHTLIIATVLGIASCKCTSKCDTKADSASVTAENMDKNSYALGTLMAADLTRNGFDSIDVSSFQQGFSDGFNKDSLLVSADSSLILVQNMAKEAQERKTKAATVKGTAFLAENKLKPGVITTESGLQYKIINKGIGAFPVATDEVEVHYKGTLIDGSVFDSSFKRGQPATFGLQQVIKGWTEGITYINEGGEIELYVPYNLAYGERGHGSVIPPYSTLIFKVKLIQIKKAAPAQEHGPHDGHNH